MLLQFLSGWSALSVSVALFAIALSSAIAYARLARLPRLVNALPGMPALPIIGSVPWFEIDDAKFFQQLTNLFLKYGDIWRVWLGPIPIVVLCSAEAAEVRGAYCVALRCVCVFGHEEEGEGGKCHQTQVKKTKKNKQKTQKSKQNKRKNKTKKQTQKHKNTQKGKKTQADSDTIKHTHNIARIANTNIHPKYSGLPQFFGFCTCLNTHTHTARAPRIAPH